MKTYKLIKVSTILLCMVLFSFQLPGQVTGNGEPIKQERNVPTFTGIEVRNGIDVFINQGDKQSVIIQAEENIQDQVITEVSGSTLQVYVKKGVNILKTKGMAAFISVTDLYSLSVSGGGDVESQSLIKTSSMDIGISGGGDLKFDLESGKTSCAVSGVGNTNISGTAGDCKLSVSGGGNLVLKTGLKNLEATISGGGDAAIESGEKSEKIIVATTGGGDLVMNVNSGIIHVAVAGGGDAKVSGGTGISDADVAISGGGGLQMDLGAENLQISTSGGGGAKLTGTVQNLDAHISSGSDLDASGLKTTVAKVNLTGGSDARLNVSGTLDLSASGGGQVYLTGKPEMKNVNLSGGSKIHNE